MDYIGEHLFPGQLGHFLVVSPLLLHWWQQLHILNQPTQYLKKQYSHGRRIARIAFVIDAVSVTVTFGIIYYLISNHYFEYYYAWNHSDKSLSTGYLLASIWEGQEGSFLLWAFWHGILGMLSDAHVEKMGSARDDGDQLCTAVYGNYGAWYSFLRYQIRKLTFFAYPVYAACINGNAELSYPAGIAGWQRV